MIQNGVEHTTGESFVILDRLSHRFQLDAAVMTMTPCGNVARLTAGGSCVAAACCGWLYTMICWTPAEGGDNPTVDMER